MPWYPCLDCCDPDACEHCSDIPPGWLCVDIAGIVDILSGVDCCEDELNGRFFLKYSTADEVFVDSPRIDIDCTSTFDCCVWGCGSYDCLTAGEFTMWAVLYKDGANYKLRVGITDKAPLTIDEAFIFEKNFGATKPECTSWDGLSVPFVGEDSTVCGAQSPTLTVTAKLTGFCCGHDSFRVLDCTAGKVPERIQVTIAGVVACLEDPCDTCCDDCTDFNGTYVLDLLDCSYQTDIDICGYDLIQVEPLSNTPSKLVIKDSLGPLENIEIPIPNDCRPSGGDCCDWPEDTCNTLGDPFGACSLKTVTSLDSVCDGNIAESGGDDNTITVTFSQLDDCVC